jgi:plasmid maintenance system antidote protein VapI
MLGVKTAVFWMALQASFDLEEARKKLGPRLKQLDRVAA